MSRDLPHDSARGHVTGRAHYVEDLPRLESELVVTFAGASSTRGRLQSIDIDGAVNLPGVAAVLTHRDIPGENRWGPIVADEPFLVEDEIWYRGQPLAVIAAESQRAADAARAAIETAEELLPPVLSIEQAETRGWYLSPERFIRRGNLELGWSEAEHTLSGTFYSAGQEQFYLESQATLAWPGEEGQIWVHSSTQNPTEIQKVIAEVLGLRQHQVVCMTRRMGGAFGGKETQAALPALMAALVTHKTGRPARVVYSKDDDMHVTGKRHPYRTDYRIGFDGDGRIVAADFRLRSNGGAFADLSVAVLERSMLHVDNAYFLPNVSISARVCRTNLPPNTAFRGFGGPQGIAVIENVMEEIAHAIGRDPLDVRRTNLYSAEQGSTRRTTPYGQTVDNNLLPELFDRLERSSGYRERRRRIAAQESIDTHLRGLALVPVKFGISFTNKTLNQANALVNVYTDGTVQLSTGATEMGQGVNVKLAKIVADELGIAAEHVLVMPTSTEKNNNTSPTAASASTDLNGSAAVAACQQIRQRLAGFAADRLDVKGVGEHGRHIRFRDGVVLDERRPERTIPFAELVAAAHVERIDLGARGFYATPDIDFDRDTGRGRPFYYFTTGCCVAEVLVDRLLGELDVVRLDVLMDIGKPLHDQIERGQVIGGLIQGIGWVTTEELVYDDDGRLLSSSPTTYKIPNVSDLPTVFNVDFLDNDLNRHNLRSTKAVGEPPLMLGIAVWAAIKDALSSIAPGRSPDLQLPATHEAILHAVTRLESVARASEPERSDSW